MRIPFFFRGVFCLLSVLIPSVGCSRQPPVDLLILNGTIVDGTGSASVVGNVAVQNGVIAAVGPSVSRPALEIIDAAGLVVSPGFIDVHNHTAPAIATLERRLNEGYLRQGVTTIVGGPDGGMTPDQIRRLISLYQEQGVGTNVAFYVGHNAIRSHVMGSGEARRQPPSTAQIEEMKSLVREGMELGAVGFSTGLMYDPGMFSQTEEVIALAREVAPWGGVYDSHVRNPVHALLESDREVIEISEAAGIPGKIDGAATADLTAIVVVPPDLHELDEYRALTGVKGLTVTPGVPGLSPDSWGTTFEMLACCRWKRLFARSLLCPPTFSG